MLQKLSFLVVIAILLTACGASAPMEADIAAAETVSQYSGTTAGAEYGIPEAAEAAGETVGEAPGAACAAEYFVFDTYSNTVTDDEGLTLMIENQTAATFYSGDPERSAWVDGILADIDQAYHADSANLDAYARDFVSMNGTEYFYSYSNYQQLGVARHDERVVSLIALSSLYSGGSHPNSVQVAYNLDIENQTILFLEDIVTESGAEALAQLVLAGVDEKFAPIDGGNGLFEDYADTISTSMTYGNMTAYWYLNDVGLVIFYNQYELGPYAAGIIKVELPYEALDGILNPEYLPPERDGSGGGLVLRESPGDAHQIQITIEREGETLLIGVEGTIYQVQLSEVLWLEDTPIAQQLLFSAKSLCENDVLEITGGYTDASRSFAIEYIDGRGNAQLVYVHDGELSAEP